MNKIRVDGMLRKLTDVNGQLSKSSETQTSLNECCKKLTALSEVDQNRRDETEADVWATVERMSALLNRVESDCVHEQRMIERRLEFLKKITAQASVYSEHSKKCVDRMRVDNKRLIDELESSKVTVDALCAQVAALSALDTLQPVAALQAESSFLAEPDIPGEDCNDLSTSSLQNQLTNTLLCHNNDDDDNMSVEIPEECHILSLEELLRKYGDPEDINDGE